MTPTICGHERELLRSRLIAAQLRDEGFDVDGNAAYRRKLLIERGRDATKLEASATKCATVDAAILDPARLAELLVAETHRRGFGHIDAYAGTRVSSWLCITISWHTWLPRRSHEARAALLRILELPQGATAEDAVKALVVNGQ